jgi:imidazolonepropionase-like amidohydrolase
VGTDTPSLWIVPGVSFVQELELLHDARIPNLAVLRMASYNAALALRKDGEWGSIRPGLRADLVVSSANPVEDLTRCRSVEAVIREGKVYRSELAGRGE